MSTRTEWEESGSSELSELDDKLKDLQLQFKKELSHVPLLVNPSEFSDSLETSQLATQRREGVDPSNSAMEAWRCKMAELAGPSGYQFGLGYSFESRSGAYASVEECGGAGDFRLAGILPVDAGHKHVFVLHIRVDEGVRHGYVLWRNIGDTSDLHEIRGIKSVTMSMAGAWALFVEPAVRRTQTVPADAIEPLDFFASFAGGFGYDACGVDAEDMTERELKLGIIAMAMKGNASKTDALNKTELVASYRQLQAATMDFGDRLALNLTWAFAAPPPDASAQEKHEEHSHLATETETAAAVLLPADMNQRSVEAENCSSASCESETGGTRVYGKEDGGVTGRGGGGRWRCKRSNRKKRGRNSK